MDDVKVPDGFVENTPGIKATVTIHFEVDGDGDAVPPEERDEIVFSTLNGVIPGVVVVKEDALNLIVRSWTLGPIEEDHDE